MKLGIRPSEMMWVSVWPIKQQKKQLLNHQ